ncbi:DUF3576 domain-containing protein [Falsigemmobacter faecalis]|uniref:DUF3576 domain-containing protein n=1 Tax=Falsigemmobacter faecalis TaxID=2488730 RepID=A0A3P3DMR7_9RHOB|nr:DUF3576 domain-containing protein [Falsigemmobacter faecalis]RRH75547.1 DUF3576 domain-containing protein [Falsigemmobacter faecalis]
MIRNHPLRSALLSAALLALAGCGNSLFGTATPGEDPFWEQRLSREQQQNMSGWNEADRKTTLRSLFGGKGEGDVGTNVNRYLWNASLDVLNFLPVESVDPFTGVISTGYGTPPGGRQAYRATIYISDPALDARSLKVALQTRGGGPVSAQVAAQVEEAILTRARQLRSRDSRL